MPPLPRRSVLLAIASLPFPIAAEPKSGDPSFAAIERDLHGELGIVAIDSASGRTIGHRQNQRFPFCSTFKTLLAAAVLARAEREPGLLDKRLSLPEDRFVSYSPITGKHAGGAMSVAELCAAALQYSDNTAGNALLSEVGGPAELTRFVRTLDDQHFRLDRWETELNSAIPDDKRDTTTPLAMAHTLQKLLLQDGLPGSAQGQLRDWMLGNTTGDQRIRAAVPAGWKVADKTGSGDYGCANDIAVIYPLGRAPVVLAIYTRQFVKDADSRNDLIVQAAKLALALLD
jgi:beta-lactamase class A